MELRPGFALPLRFKRVENAFAVSSLRPAFVPHWKSPNVHRGPWADESARCIQKIGTRVALGNQGGASGCVSMIGRC